MRPLCRYYGSEMTAKRVKNWLHSLGTQPLYIESGSPWENGLLRIVQRKTAR